MSVRTHRSRARFALAGAAVGLLLALPAMAAPPIAMPVGQAEYQPTQEGFQHFVQDTLGGLVKGKTWTWGGHEYTGVELHRIHQAEVGRPEAPASRDHGTGLRGWSVCIIHVKVDGRLVRAKVAGNAAFTSDGTGWRWTEVLLYLGVGDSYDFVSGQVR